MKPRSGPPPATSPQTKPPAHKPSTTATAPAASPSSLPPAASSSTSAGDEPLKARLGLAKKTKAAAAPKTAEQVARAFEKGDVTLGTVLGVTKEQRTSLQERAFSLLKDKRPEAMSLLEGLVALDPFDVWALAALAGLKIDADQLPLALTLLDRALQVDTSDVVARALRAEARHKSGDAVGAQEDLKALDAADQNSLPVKRARALVPPPKVAPTSTKLLRPPSRAPQKPGATTTPRPQPKPLPPR